MKFTILSIAICCLSFSLINAQQLPDPVIGSFTDSRDGKTYKTVKIGDQVWMAENLAYLPAVSGPSAGSQTEPFWYVYGYDGTDIDAAKATGNYSTYGVLYNWPAAMTACPSGWHLPSDAEWTTLENYLIANGYNYDGTTTDNKIAKSMATATGWNSYSEPGTVGNTDYPAYQNKSGFSALPGGYRYYDGSFVFIGVSGLWWSSTEYSTAYAWCRYMNYLDTGVGRGYGYEEYGSSVRCVRDESYSTDTLSIHLKNGWNLFSTNVIPDSTNLKTLFTGLIEDEKLVKIQDESGNAIEDIGDFGSWVNQIGNIALTEGYRINVNDSVNIQFKGENAGLPFEIPLKAGWNIIGYPRSSEMDAMEVVQQLIDRQTLLMVQDENGNTLEKTESTGEWVNGIGKFKPGKGYKVRVKSDDVLLFENLPPELPFNPSPADSAASVEPSAMLSWDCNDPEGDEMTYDVYMGKSADLLELVIGNQTKKSFTPEALQFGTVYFWRVTARDSHGNTTEGPLWKFRVRNETGSFTDSRDNTTYNTVRIGDQWWMAQNLAYLPAVSGPSTGSETEPFWYVYDYDGTDIDAAKATGNYSTYGVLYNWSAAMTACPVGWHLPSDAEWTTLTGYLISSGYGYEGSGDDIAKSMSAQTNWFSYSTPGTPGNDPASNNSSGFSALPGGCRDYDGTFDAIWDWGTWWSSTVLFTSNALIRYMACSSTYVHQSSDFNIGGYSVRCVRDPISVPSVSTFVSDSITNDSVILGGEVTFDGWAEVTERGVCYGTTQTPTTENSRVTMGSGTGSFSGKITGLAAKTTYYVRAYAINSQGTAYGDEVSFTTLANPTGTFVDSRDGNEYDWVKIGDQVWMAQNLAYLPAVSGPSAGSNTEPFWYVYGYDGSDIDAAKATGNYSTYGVLYNWPAALTACPAGWHLPSDAEWTTLENYLIANGYNYDGTTSGNKIAKSMATATGWESYSEPGTVGNTDYPAYQNKSGFSALPGGYRDFSGDFISIGYFGLWWSSTEFSTTFAWSRYMYFHHTYVRRSLDYKENGFSVRCVRD